MNYATELLSYFMPPLCLLQPPSTSPEHGTVFKSFMLLLVFVCLVDLIARAILFSSCYAYLKGKWEWEKDDKKWKDEESEATKYEASAVFKGWDKNNEKWASDSEWEAGWSHTRLSQVEVVQASRSRSGGTEREEGLNERLTSSEMAEQALKKKKEIQYATSLTFE